MTTKCMYMENNSRRWLQLVVFRQQVFFSSVIDPEERRHQRSRRVPVNLVSHRVIQAKPEN